MEPGSYPGYVAQVDFILCQNNTCKCMFSVILELLWCACMLFIYRSVRQKWLFVQFNSPLLSCGLMS